MVNSFYLDENTLLFCDIFYKNSKLYLICPVNWDGIKMPKLSVYCNGKILNLSQKYSKLEKEAAEVLIYNIESDEHEIKVLVKYDNMEKEYILCHIKSTINNKLSLTTLFKTDYKIIDIFYDYYIKQGVTIFYMYYNGKLTDDIISLFNKPGIILIEWDFPYYHKNKFSTNYGQMAQLHHALYRYGKEENEYMMFCDLDEYLYIPGIPILKYIENNPSIDLFGFRNIWANTLDGKVPDKFPETFKCSAEIFPFMTRSKCVYKTDAIGTLGVHHPWRKNHLRVLKKSCDHVLYHFYDWYYWGAPRSFDTPKEITLDTNYAV
jgi:hypothetical protein